MLITKSVGTNFLFSLYVEQDAKSTDEHILYLDQPSFGLYPEYLKLGKEDPIVQAYQTFSSEVKFVLSFVLHLNMNFWRESKT